MLRVKHFWQKIKALLKNKNTHKENDNANIKDVLENVVAAIGIFAPQIHQIREQLNSSEVELFTSETLEITTNLYYIENLLSKMREYILLLRYRQDQCGDASVLKTPEFVQARYIAQQCYKSIVLLSDFVQVYSRKKKMSQNFFNEVKILEKNTNGLGDVIRDINKLAYRQETLEQIAHFEQGLLQTLTMLNENKRYAALTNYVTHIPLMLYTSDEYLRSKLPQIRHQQHSDMILQLIDAYDKLKKCYVIYKKLVIKETLENMVDNIDELIEIFSQEKLEEEKVIMHLHHIYNLMESLLFSAHRENRCSKNLFEKTKQARHQLRCACAQDPIGSEFLKQICMKVSLVTRVEAKGPRINN